MTSTLTVDTLVDIDILDIRASTDSLDKDKNIIKMTKLTITTGCITGNGEKLSSTQAEPGQAMKSAVA